MSTHKITQVDNSANYYIDVTFLKINTGSHSHKDKDCYSINVYEVS